MDAKLDVVSPAGENLSETIREGRLADVAILILRVVSGIVMIRHGVYRFQRKSFFDYKWREDYGFPRGSVLLTGILQVACITGVWAQGYPERPLRLIVGFTAGGTTDVVARLVAQQLTLVLNQSVVVENKPGAGGVIGAEFVARARPDGYTLLMANAGNATAAAIMRKLPFDTVPAFAWIGTATTYPFVISTGSQSSFKSLNDVIVSAKAIPGKVSYGSAGVGVSGHLLGEWFCDAIGVDLLHVPFKGGAGAVIEVIAGRIDIIVEPVVATLPYVKGGKLRALAVTSPQPTSFLPGVPAAAQTVPGYVFQSWLGLAAPAGTPLAIVERLNRDLRRILAEPDMQKRLAEFGGVAAPSSPDEMRAQVTSEIDRWRKLVRNRNIEQQ